MNAGSQPGAEAPIDVAPAVEATRETPHDAIEGAEGSNSQSGGASAQTSSVTDDQTMAIEPASAAPLATEASAVHSSVSRLAWFREAARVATFRAPDWPALPPITPLWLVAIFLLQVLVFAGLQFIAVVGPAQFYPQAIHSIWMPQLATVFACWAVTFQPGTSAKGAAAPAAPRGLHATAALVALSTLATLFVAVVSASIYLPLLVTGGFDVLGPMVQWGLWGASLAWSLAAIVVLLMRETRSSVGSLVAVTTLASSALLSVWLTPPVFWYPDTAASASEARDDERWNTDHLQPDKLLKQAGLLETALASLPDQRPGQVDVYVITYSPYAGEEVFLRESKEVSRVMAERYGAAAHTVQLVNNRATVENLPWATPGNLRKAIAHVGKLIDPDEDMVFIHFASHGGSDGRLASEFWPMQVERLRADEVREALDAAKIPVRLLSVSACYSGTWIAPLATDGTLIMTASDDKHTSYGCGRKSELTFFTRAVFSEQLGSKTRDFEQAIAAARPIIEAREKEAGKEDGFSNPQIHVGPLARERLERWRTQLEAR